MNPDQKSLRRAEVARLRDTIPGSEILYPAGLLSDIERCKLDGEYLELFVTTCPAYTTNENGEFVFNGEVHPVAGLVAEQCFAQLLGFADFANARGVHCRMNFVYADTEAGDLDIQATMNCAPDRFASTIEHSKQVAVYRFNSQLARSNLYGMNCVSVLGMSDLFTDEIIQAADNVVTQMSEGDIHGLAISRVRLYERMFARVLPNSPKARVDFILRRARKDILDHVALSLVIRRMRNEEAVKASIVTMSIPELASYFNFERADESNQIPVIRLTQRY